MIIVAPHTSWTDFFVGLFARGIIGLRMHWVGKNELFRIPFSWYFRWMGGEPLDRSGGRDTVSAIISIFSRQHEFRLAISPEGTRKKVNGWRTGFYYIAIGAGVPVIPVAFDYFSKTVIIHDPFFPTGDALADIDELRNLFEGVVGRSERLP